MPSLAATRHGQCLPTLWLCLEVACMCWSSPSFLMGALCHDGRAGFCCAGLSQAWLFPSSRKPFSAGRSIIWYGVAGWVLFFLDQCFRFVLVSSPSQCQKG